MRFVLTLLLTATLGYILGIFLDWWSVALAAFVIALLYPQPAGKAFISGFLAVFLLWGVLATIMGSRNDHILATRMANLILKSPSPGTMVVITALLGGLVGGLVALSASVIRYRKPAPKR